MTHFLFKRVNQVGPASATFEIVDIRPSKSDCFGIRRVASEPFDEQSSAQPIEWITANALNANYIRQPDDIINGPDALERRSAQMNLNFTWLLEQIDATHRALNLPPNTWQERATALVAAAKDIQNTHFQRALEYLNRAIEADPAAMSALFSNYMPSARALAYNTDVVCRNLRDDECARDEFVVSALGLICGLVNVMTGKKPAAVYDDKYPERVLRVKEYEPSATPNNEVH